MPPPVLSLETTGKFEPILELGQHGKPYGSIPISQGTGYLLSCKVDRAGEFI
jgi:hypothetical protein